MQRKHTGSEYLEHTLRSLVRHIAPPERKHVTILVFLADMDHSVHAETKRSIMAEHSQHLSSGFILIMEVDQSAYPSLDGLKHNFNDKEERVRWRAKQVLDYAFMFYTGKDFSKYYMQIEDDVISSMGLFKKIQKGIMTVRKSWTTLEFAELGFIGKLYKTEDLARFARFLCLFYAEQPVDWLYTYYFRLLTQKKAIVITPSLFQHFGLHSSFHERITEKPRSLNTLKEKRFADPDPRDLAEVVLSEDTSTPESDGRHLPKGSSSDRAHEYLKLGAVESAQPEAEVYTSIKVYRSFLPFNAYVVTDSSFFWGTTARENDTFTVVFQRPVRLSSVDVMTGHPKHPDDFLRSAVLEHSVGELRVGAILCDDDTYHVTQTFRDGQVHVAGLCVDDVKCLRIRLMKHQKQWVAITSIQINQY